MNREGYLPVPGGMVWFRQIGAGTGVPLLVLHGGPGAGSDYLQILAAVADERPVILYDQLGGGRSERPTTVGLWRLERFVAEVAAVRRMLGCDRVHLYGHSWGGWLALEYLLTAAPTGVVSLTLASTSAGLAEQLAELDALRAALPPTLAATLRRWEADGDLTHPDYRAAVVEFYQRHLCRSPVWPAELTDVVVALADSPVYRAMLGASELVVTGPLRHWDRTADLGRIDVPTLVTVGRYDEITPRCAETLHRGLKDSRLVVFEDSAHMPHLEEQVAYLASLRQFLAAVESTDGGARMPTAVKFT